MSGRIQLRPSGGARRPKSALRADVMVEYAPVRQRSESTLRRAAHLATQAIAAKACAVCWVSSNSVRLIATYGIGKNRQARSLPKDFSWFAPEEIAASHKPEVVQKILDFLGVDGYSFVVAVPLWSHLGDSMGAMLLLDTEPRDLPPEDLEVLSGIADLAMDGINAALTAGASASANPLEAALLQAKESLIAFDPSGKIFAWNAGAEDIYGRPAQSMIGKAFFELIPSESRAEFELLLQELQQKPIAPSEVTRLHQSGFRLQVRSSLHAIRSSNGVLEGFLELSGLSANPERMAAVGHFRSLVEHLPMVFVQTDAKGLVRFAEGRVLLEQQRTRQDLLGRSVFELYKNHPEVISALEVALRGESLHRVVSWSGRFFELWASPLLQGGRFIGSNILAVDITEQHQHQEQTKQSAQVVVQRIEQLLDSLPVLLISFNQNGTITLLEGAGVVHFGGEAVAARWLGQPIQRLFAQDPIVSNLIEGALAGEEFNVAFEFRGLQIEVFVRPTLEDGVFVGSSAVVLDRSESHYATARTDQLRAEFLQQQTLLSSVFETIDQGVTIANKHSQIEYVSPVFARMLDYAPEEMLGREVLEFVHPEARQTLQNAQRERNEGWRGQYRHLALRKDGSSVLLEVSAFPRLDPQGEVIGSIALLRDVTLESEHAEEFDALKHQLEQQREFALSIANSLRSGLVVTDHNAKYQFINPAFSELLGYTLLDLQSLTPFDLVYHEDHKLLEMALEQRRKGQNTTYRYRLVHKDGHLIHVEARATPRLGQQMEIVGTITIIEDITEQLLLEQAAHHARRALERESRNAVLVANAVSDGLLFIAADNLIEYANPAAVSILGAQHAKEVIGRRSREWVYGADLEALRANRQALEQGQSPSIRLRVQRPSGELIPVLLTAHPRLERQKLVGSIVVLNDLRPELEQEARQQEQQQVLLESQARYRELFMQAQAVRERLELVDHIRNVATLCETVRDLVQTVVETLAQTLGIKLVSIYFLQDETLVLQHQVGYNAVIERFALSDGGVMVRAVTKRHVELIPDAHKDADFRYPMPDVRSELAVPILSGQNVLGVINLESDMVAAFDQDHAHLLVQVAERIANKIEITQKLEQYQTLEQQYQALLSQNQVPLERVN
jgi:PAS domain S-box-containing protein